MLKKPKSRSLRSRKREKDVRGSVVDWGQKAVVDGQFKAGWEDQMPSKARWIFQSMARAKGETNGPTRDDGGKPAKKGKGNARPSRDANISAGGGEPPSKARRADDSQQQQQQQQQRCRQQHGGSSSTGQHKGSVMAQPLAKPPRAPRAPRAHDLSMPPRFGETNAQPPQLTFSQRLGKGLHGNKPAPALPRMVSGAPPGGAPVRRAKPGPAV